MRADGMEIFLRQAQLRASLPGQPGPTGKRWTVSPADPLQRASPVRDHPTRIGEGGEQPAHDPQAGVSARRGG
jgi:hypothetical protein